MITPTWVDAAVFAVVLLSVAGLFVLAVLSRSPDCTIYERCHADPATRRFWIIGSDEGVSLRDLLSLPGLPEIGQPHPDRPDWRAAERSLKPLFPDMLGGDWELLIFYRPVEADHKAAA